MIKVLCISEPWDYSSCDGNNIMVINTLYKRNDNIVSKVLSITNYDYSYISITKRDNKSNLNIWSYDIQKDNNIEFVAIGYFASLIDSFKYIIKYMLK